MFVTGLVVYHTCSDYSCGLGDRLLEGCHHPSQWVVGHTINFAHGLTGTILLQSSLPAVIQYMIINGAGTAALAINGQGRYYCFMVDARLDLSGVTVENCTGTTGGAIINLNTLVLSNADLKYNTASSAGGAHLQRRRNGADQCQFRREFGFQRSGAGAVYNVGSASLTSVTLGGNWAAGGGAIPNFGALSGYLVSFAGNTSRNGLGGGAVENESAFTCTACSFLNNSSIQATEGGGAVLNDGAFAAIESTFWLNSADTSGGCGLQHRGGCPVLRDHRQQLYSGRSGRRGVSQR